MTADALQALAKLIKAIEKAEVQDGLFLKGSVSLADSDGDLIAEIKLNGTDNHELVGL